MSRVFGALVAFLLAASIVWASTTTPNLGLVIPSIGAAGPQYATEINTNFAALDFGFTSPLVRTGTQISVNDASTVAKGAAQFSSLFFSVTGGLVTLVGGGIGASEIATGAVGPTQLASTAVTPGAYTNTSLTVGADGRITLASSGGASGAPIDPTYLTLSTNGTLLNERVLTVGTGLSFVDGGAGSTLTVNLANTAVTPGAYTNTSLTVDQQGRLTAASSGSAGSAPTDASYLTLGLHGTLTAERLLTAGTGISFVDGGANGALTINNNGVLSVTGTAPISSSGGASPTLSCPTCVVLEPSVTQASPSTTLPATWITRTSTSANVADLSYWSYGTAASNVTGSVWQQSKSNGVFSVDIFDALTVAGDGAWGGGTLGFSVYQRKRGGSGNRGAIDGRVDVSSSSSAANFFVGGGFFAIAQTGVTGQFFGSNPYVQILPGALSTLSAIGEEIDTDVRVATVSKKIGLQIADIGTSIGNGTYRNTAIRFVNQAGATGFDHGLFFDAPNATEPTITPSVKTTGALLSGAQATYTFGIDFGAISFSSAAIRLKQGGTDGKIQWQIGNSYIYFDGANMVISAAAGSIVFQANAVNKGYVDLATGQYCRVGGGCTAL